MKNGLQGQLRIAARWMVSVAAVSLWTQAALAAPPTTATGINAVTAGDSRNTATAKCNVNRDGVRIGDCGTSPNQQWRPPGQSLFGIPVEVTPGSVRITNRDF